MRLLLRPTTRADLHAVARLERSGDSARWLATTGLAWHRAALADPAVDHRVALLDDRLAGFLVLAEAPRSSLELRRLVVRPALRGSGVGGALVRACVAVARHRGLRRVFLDVADGNTTARNLYAALGFTEVALPQRYVGHPVPQGFAVMVLPLR